MGRPSGDLPPEERALRKRLRLWAPGIGSYSTDADCAPPTDFRWYDTAYTERYLGLPSENPDGYEADSLISDAPGLGRPLLLIHGLADDNVYPLDTLRLSDALTRAGRPHSTLLLPGVSHMTPDGVAENMMAIELDFLRRNLDMTPPTPAWRSDRDVAWHRRMTALIKTEGAA